MNAAQRKIVQLIAEFADLCAAASIPFCAADRLAWDTKKFHRFHDATYDALMFVFEEDIPVFRKAFDAAEMTSRSFVSMDTKDAIGAEYRYVADDSCLIDATVPLQEKPGLAVGIKVVKKNSNGAFCWTLPNGKEFTSDVNPVITDERDTFEGLAIPLPANYDSLFTAIVGKNWRDNNYKGPIRKIHYRTVAEPDIPYEVFFAKANDLNVFSEDDQRMVKDYFDQEKEYLRARKKVNSTELPSILEATRFRLSEKYLPHKAVLLEAWKKGEYELVKDALQDYTSQLEYFSKYGITVHFDCDLLSLERKMLTHFGRSDFSRKLTRQLDLADVSNELSSTLCPLIGQPKKSDRQKRITWAKEKAKRLMLLKR